MTIAPPLAVTRLTPFEGVTASAWHALYGIGPFHAVILLPELSVLRLLKVPGSLGTRTVLWTEVHLRLDLTVECLCTWLG